MQERGSEIVNGRRTRGQVINLEARAQAKAALERSLAVQREILRRAAPGSLEAFEYRFLPSQFFADPGTFHLKCSSDIEALLHRKPIASVGGESRIFDAAAFACPRGHGKTTGLVLGPALWVACEWQTMSHFRGRAPYVVLVSDTIEQARERLADIREQLETNEDLIATYGEFAPRKGERRRRKWNSTVLELPDGTIFRAIGAGSKARGLLRKGRRPNLLLLDDMENDEQVLTEKRRDKLRRWFTGTLIPTGIEGELVTIVVGTILHADSLLARLVGAEHFEGFLKRRYAAQYNDLGLPDVDGEIILWPEYWTRERLHERRKKIGSLAYAQEYLNQPVDDAQAVFRMAWLRAAIARGKGRPFLYEPPKRIPFNDVVRTWDPVELANATDSNAYQVVVTAYDLGIVDDEEKALASDSDYTVGVTLGLTADDRFELLRVYRARGLTPVELQQRVIADANLLAPDYVGIENNQAQRIHEWNLKQALGGRVVGHTTTTKKSSIWDGVPSLALMFEAGRIDFCANEPQERKRVDELVRELHGLGHERHDDTVMALWICATIIRRWMAVRNLRRRKMIGAPPPGYYVDPFPQREEKRAA